MPEPALELYWFALDDIPPASLARWSGWLSAAERARAARFVVPAQGRRFTVAHARLREILAQRLQRAPGDLEFDFGPQGKPVLKACASAPPLHFNLSHAGGYALVGVHTRELGVDLEAERPHLDGLGLAHRFFTANEAAWLAALRAADRPRGFCRLWSCKEAWLKADGRGLMLPLKQVEVSFAPSTAVQELAPPRRRWFVQELDLLPGYCAAVVQSTRPAKVTVTRCDEPVGAKSSPGS